MRLKNYLNYLKILLKKFAKTKETKLPHYVGEAGENFAFSTDPLNFANFACAGTNVLAKQELMNWWAKQGLSEEQQEQAIDNIMKVMHGMYTNFHAFFLDHLASNTFLAP
jgi:hypothetical protein